MRTLVLCLMFITLIATPVRMQNLDQKVEKARQAAAKIAVEGEHLGEIKFRTGEKRKGRIISVNQDSFTLEPAKGGSAETIRFADVDSIKKSKKGLSEGAWIAIAAVSAAAVILTFTVIKPILCDGGAGC
ncbi:MAG TPA: hypothetical protein PLP21_02465 [Pyrinomonadaceae bacterium]|nr:hypothetical protein [Acidobacteriota bacterium]HQZ95149.1 hypothetical protein [Pyrinomonadaceae bacterium]